MLIQRHGVKEVILDSLVFSVSQLNSSVKSVLESNEYLYDVYVKGEISNMRRLESGSVFFTLKEKNSSLKCFMKRINADELDEDVKEGSSVIVRGSIGVYAARGEYYLEVEDVYKQGIGELYKKFLELKEKLEQEGLFEESNKKKIPLYPESIGIVTSPTGAVIKDMVNTLERRYPLTKIFVSPATVQGSKASKSIIRGIEQLEENNVDVIIIARGGGSLEDLWCFNDELLARKIFSCKTPIITGIGHETDYTIADFAADLRAPTPSIAAERATQSMEEIQRSLRSTTTHMHDLTMRKASELKAGVEDNAYRVKLLAKSYAEKKKLELLRMENSLRHTNHEAILGKGYVLVEKNNELVKSKNKLKEKDKITLVFKDGKVKAKVSEVVK